jgi:hypothetical protein
MLSTSLKARLNLVLFYHEQKGKAIGKPPLINKIVKSDISRPDPYPCWKSDDNCDIIL